MGVTEDVTPTEQTANLAIPSDKGEIVTHPDKSIFTVKTGNLTRQR